MKNQKNTHTNNNQLKRIINEKISLITATKWVKYLRTKEMSKTHTKKITSAIRRH